MVASFWWFSDYKTFGKNLETRVGNVYARRQDKYRSTMLDVARKSKNFRYIRLILHNRFVIIIVVMYRARDTVVFQRRSENVCGKESFLDGECVRACVTNDQPTAVPGRRHFNFDAEKARTLVARRSKEKAHRLQSVEAAATSFFPSNLLAIF
jgi:hypothetical protein